jgi:TRAP-type C4-dicarboxylate transport system substrate-binding protein
MCTVYIKTLYYRRCLMRGWIKGVGFMVVLLFGILCLSFKGYSQVIKLKYANFPPAPTFPCVQMERWAKEVEKRTQGQVKVETYPGGTLLGAKNMLDGVIAGIADIGCFCPSYHPGRFPLLEAIDLPWGWPNTKVPSLTLLRLYEKWKPAGLKDVKVITMFTCAPNHIASKVPIRRLSDLKGVELRAAGTLADFLTLLGATPVAMPMSDVPEALQKGIIKGYLSSLEVLKDFNYAEYCRYVTYLGYQVVSFAVVMNMKSWESLPKNVKDVIEGMKEEQAIWTANYMDNYIKEVVAWAQNKYKVEFIDLPKEDKDRINALVKPMFDKYTQRAKAAGVPVEEVLKDIENIKASIK